jgi:hypothetical protein
MEFISTNYSELRSEYERLYKTDYCDKDHSKQVRKHVNVLIKKAKLDNYELMFSYRKSVR